MNTVSGSSSYSTSKATSYGMSGLISGLDTEGMVESMLSGTQSKIDKQNAEKQQILWKQEIYRELITSINGFRDTFFGSRSTTNLSSESFFNAMTATSASKAFSVLATSEAAAGKTSVKVGQMATSTKLQSGGAVSGVMRGDMDLSALERRVVFNVDGKEVSLKLDAAPETKLEDGKEVKLTAEERLESLVQQINDQLKDQGVSGLEASVQNGKLSLKGGDFRVSTKSSKLGLDMLGLSAGSKPNNGTLESNVKLDAAVNFDMTLNGITRTITLDGVESGADLTRELQSRIDDAFGKGWVTVDATGGKFTLTANGKGNIVSVDGNRSGLNLLGVESGESNKISRSQQLKNVNFAQQLEGGRFEFSINDVQFSFTGETTLNDMIKEINNSKAGVRITYSDIEDKFTIEAANTGAGYEIRMDQTSGNLLNAMFGNVVSTGTSVISKELLSNKLFGSKDLGMDLDSFEGGTFDIVVNGVNYSISVPQKANGNYNREELMKAINEGLANQLGYVDGGASDGLQAIELVQNPAGGYRMEVRNGAKVSFGDLSVDASDTAAYNEKAKSALQLAFGFHNTSNVAQSPSELKLSDAGIDFSGASSFTVGGTTLSASSTVEELMNAIRSQGFDVSFEEGRIQIEATGTAQTLALPDQLAGLFGTNQLNFDQAQGDSAAIQQGQNAVVSVNGVLVERSSNTFTVNGLTLTLNDVTGSIAKFHEVTKDDGTTVWEDEDGVQYTLDGSGNILNADGKPVKAFEGMTIGADGYLTKDGSRVILGDEETINTTRNTDQVVEGLKSFVEKYNELIEKLNKLVDADATYREYAPLTSAQKKEMSEREIELWEEKAKEGLLRRDSDLESFLGNMRAILYTKPTGSDYSLYDIGIETSSEWRDKGKLVLDEEKLRSIVETNAQGIQQLFTNSVDGLAEKLAAELDRTANLSSARPGTLVELAGVQGRATALTNTLTRRINSINERIKELESKYQTEKQRYWNQFNAMEKALANLNTQSSWLMQQFGQ